MAVAKDYTGAFLEPAAETITDKLMAELQQPVDIKAIAPQIAAVSPLTQEAMQMAATQSGLGTLSFDPTTGELTGVGKGTGIAAYEPFLQAAQAATGPTGYQAYMSPYQQEVLDATEKLLAEQRAAGRSQLAANAITAGAFGGGREGVARAEYERERDIYDAGMLAQLRQQGFEQAQKAAQQQVANQLNLAGRQQQMQGVSAQQVGALGTGAQQYSQSLLEAQRQGNVLGMEYPLARLGTAGGILSPLIAGYPGAPIPSPLDYLQTSPAQTAIGSFAGAFKGLQPATQAAGQAMGGLGSLNLGSLFG